MATSSMANASLQAILVKSVSFLMQPGKSSLQRVASLRPPQFRLRPTIAKAMRGEKRARHLVPADSQLSRPQQQLHNSLSAERSPIGKNEPTRTRWYRRVER